MFWNISSVNNLAASHCFTNPLNTPIAFFAVCIQAPYCDVCKKHWRLNREIHYFTAPLTLFISFRRNYEANLFPNTIDHKVILFRPSLTSSARCPNTRYNTPLSGLHSTGRKKNRRPCVEDDAGRKTLPDGQWSRGDSSSGDSRI